MSATREHAVDLLPWLLNGSLEETERQRIVAHLSECTACRRELEATHLAGRIFAQHIPSLALAEYAEGLAIGGITRERIERHLSECAACREELDLAMSDRLVNFEQTRRARAVPVFAPATIDSGRVASWRRAALAASIVAVLSSGGLIWSLLEEPTMPMVETHDRLVQPARAGEAVQSSRASPALDVEQRVSDNDFESGGVGSWKLSDREES